MNCRRGVFSVVLAVAGTMTAAAQNPPSGKAPEQYLFVIETSKAIQRRAQGVHDTVKAFLDSNLGGQLRQGDTLAIWTFNDNIYTNRFPAQGWSVAARAAFGARLPDFLDSGTYEKRSALDRTINRLTAWASNIDLVTIILVTTGEEEIQGTPFDAQLKRTFAQWRGDQQKARMPLVTLLRASHGKFIQWSVTPAPWPLEIPPLTPETLAARAQRAQTNAVTARPTLTGTNRVTQNPPAATTSTAPALVIRGDSNTNTARVENVPATKTTNSSPAPAAVIPATNRTAVAPETKTNATQVSSLQEAPLVPTNSPPVAATNQTPSNLIAFAADTPRREAGTQTIVFTEIKDPPQTVPDTAAADPATASQTLSSPTPLPNIIPPISQTPSKPIVMTSSHSFLHENAKWIFVACVGGLTSACCLVLWLNTYRRNHVQLLPLGKAKKAE